MYANVPDLKEIEKNVNEFLATDVTFKERMPKGNAFIGYDLSFEIFPQLWGSTCTGFDVTEDGMAAIGGCAMTEEYTVVVHERVTNTYLIFFGNQLAYEVTEPNEAFLSDLKNKNLESLSQAKLKY